MPNLAGRPFGQFRDRRYSRWVSGLVLSVGFSAGSGRNFAGVMSDFADRKKKRAARGGCTK